MKNIKTLNNLIEKVRDVLSSWIDTNSEELKDIPSDELYDLITDNIIEAISDEITCFIMEND
jgi:vacuolar-type H+-ATPase subunit E/Vma4